MAGVPWRTERPAGNRGCGRSAFRKRASAAAANQPTVRRPCDSVVSILAESIGSRDSLEPVHPRGRSEAVAFVQHGTPGRALNATLFPAVGPATVARDLDSRCASNGQPVRRSPVAFLGAANHSANFRVAGAEPVRPGYGPIGSAVVDAAPDCPSSGPAGPPHHQPGLADPGPPVRPDRASATDRVTRPVESIGGLTDAGGDHFAVAGPGCNPRPVARGPTDFPARKPCITFAGRPGGPRRSAAIHRRCAPVRRLTNAGGGDCAAVHSWESPNPVAGRARVAAGVRAAGR